MIDNNEIRENLAYEASLLIDTKWQFNQSNKWGIDCLRFWEKVVTNAGIYVPPLPEKYGRGETLDRIKDFLTTNYTLTEDIYLGNLLLFNWRGTPHMGMVYYNELPNDDSICFIHASYSAKKVVVNRLNNHFKNKLNSVYQLF